MSTFITPQKLNALLEGNNLPPLEAGQIEVLFASIPRPYAQSLVAGLQQHDRVSFTQFRAWIKALDLHGRILRTISDKVALSAVYAACKLKTPRIISELLLSAEQKDRNAIQFLTEHLREGYVAVQQKGLPALLALGGESQAGQGTTGDNRINSMPPPDDAPVSAPAESRPARSEQQAAPPRRRDDQHSRPQSQDARDYQERRVLNHPTRDRPVRQDNTERAAAPSPSTYDQKACYGRDTAIQFERCLNKDRTNYTVNITIAKATGSSSRGGMNWNDKIIMMLTPKEVQLILAVLRGFVPSVRFAGHGQTNDKWIEVKETEDQYAGAIRFTIARGQERRNVNVGPDDVGEVMSLFFRTACDQLKQTDGLLVDLAVRRTADLYQKQQANKPQRPAGQGQGQGSYRDRRAG